MSFIRTVLGDITPENPGVCYAHEHIIIDASYTTVVDDGFLLNDVDAATRELSECHALGVRAMIDSRPCDFRRNVMKLNEISRRSGVHIVCPTDLHLAKYYDPGHWRNFYSEEELAALFLTEITEGIYARDCNGLFPQRTPHRAGLIKIATAGLFVKASRTTHRRQAPLILTNETTRFLTPSPAA